MVVGLRIMMNYRWRLLGHDEWRPWLQGQSGGAAVVVIGFFFFWFWFWFCLGLRCKSCDVWRLEQFGFNEDGRVVMGGAVVDSGCWVTWCSTIGLFFIILIWGLFGFEVWIMWCLMVGTVWVWNRWVGSDGWCYGGR